MAANIEVLLDMCLGSCLKPGIVNLDLHALKRFLHDLSHGVQDLEKTNVQRIVDDLTLKVFLLKMFPLIINDDNDDDNVYRRR